MLVLYNYTIVVHHIHVISSTAMLENILAPYIRVFFLNAAEMKERERLAQKEWIGVAPCCAVAPGSSPETRSWLFGLPESGALTLSSGIGLFVMSQCTGGKKTKKESWMKFRLKHMTNIDQPSSEWSTHTTFQNETTDLVTGNNQLRFKNGARSAQGCTGAAYMQFERYRNASPMVSLECVKWLGHVPIPSHHAG